MPVSTEPILLSPEANARVNRKIAENGYLNAEDVIANALDALDPEEAELEPRRNMRSFPQAVECIPSLFHAERPRN